MEINKNQSYTDRHPAEFEVHIPTVEELRAEAAQLSNDRLGDFFAVLRANED